MGVEMIETGWLSVLPPLIAIVLALRTKEVYSSLFTGIFSGMLIYCLETGTGLLEAVRMVLDMVAYKIGDNGYMILYLSLLGAVVMVVTMAGGSRAYGKWAIGKLKSKRSAKIATALLGCLIFIDDYFNCLTVGTVMRPITDKHKIVREKLAYIIDSTAAPICIIAPISSWAVAVASEVGGDGGLGAFVQTIPYNLYALLTLLMVAIVCVTDFDFGKMKRVVTEAATQKKDEEDQKELENVKISDKGRVYDLLVPMLVLIACSILGMAYVGGFFQGVAFTTAIGENPTAGLALGALAALICAMLLYIPRKLVTFREFMGGITAGVKLMVSAIMILALAWSLSGVCREMIGTGEFVSSLVSGSSVSLSILPAIIFVVAAFLSFSMGTAWGTFGILIPIVSMICEGSAEGASILIPALGATLAGSVYGDHCSPISDTTILSSAGAKCEHIRHVETQIPYATMVAAVCFVGYIIAGYVRNPWITLTASVVMLLGVIVFLAYRQKKYKARVKRFTL